MSPLSVSSVTDMGALARPKNVLRDGGSSVPVSSTRMLYLFGDSIVSGAMSDNSSAFAKRAKPRMMEPQDPVTNQYIPHTQVELDYNNSHGSDDRYAVWPTTGIIRASDHKLFIGYHVIHIAPSAWITTEAGIATAKPSSEHATRHVLWKNTDLVEEWQHQYGYPALGTTRETVYLFSPVKFGGELYTRSIFVAKVGIHGIANPSSYLFWNGEKWVADKNNAVVVLAGSLSGVSAQFHAVWNKYLKRWLGVYTTLGSVIRGVTAPRPQGPWSAPTDLFTGKTPKVGSFDYAAYQHPEISRQDGKVIYITYAHPIGDWDADLRMVRVVFS